MMNSVQITNTLDEQSTAFLEAINQSNELQDTAQADQEWNMNLIHQLPSAIIIEPDEDSQGEDEDDQDEDKDDQ